MTSRRPLFVALASVLLAACSDATHPAVAPLETSASNTLASQKLDCSVNVNARTVSCADEQGNTSARSPIIVGGQNEYVKLTSSNVSWVGSNFSFDVTVQNLIPQAMGTTDGVNPDGTGVQIFFNTLPTVTGGTGTISVSNPTGTNGTFLSSNQTFYTYAAAQLGADGILSQNEVSSSKNWQFNVPQTVTTFSFSVYVSANVANPAGYVSLTANPAMIASGTQVVSATVKSNVGNTISGQTVTYSSSTPSVATVASDGTITAVSPGSATITGTSGARTGTTTVTVCPNLAVGATYEYTGTAAASFCLAGTGAGQEYVVIPHNGDNSTTVGLSVTGSNIVAVSGNPSPYIANTAASVSQLFTPKSDDDIEATFRARERALVQQLGAAPASRISTLKIPGSSRAITTGVPTVGATMTLNVDLANGCTGGDNRTATVKAVGTHIILMEDNTNPSGGLSGAQYSRIAADFDTLVYPVITGAFGTPNDIDNNSRVIALYTTAINALTPSGSSGYTGGLFYSRDLYTAGQCATSNIGEMFYMLAPDPTGTINNNVRTAGLVDSSTVGTLAHEFQHLINASRRINSGFNQEQSWLNEGQAHIAEEKIYYASSGKTSGSNIQFSDIYTGGAYVPAYFSFGSANIGRLYSWLAAPDANSATQGNASLAQRGAAWAFLRYALDRKGGTENTILSALASNTDTGRTNVTNRLGVSMDSWLKDYVVASYADDAGISAGSTYLMPSWNFRSIFASLNYGQGFGVYALKVANPANNVASSATLVQNGAAYIRMGVSASNFATISVSKSGGGNLPSNLSVIVLRRK